MQSTSGTGSATPVQPSPPHDCMQCRSIAATTFGGIAVYLLVQRHRMPKVEVANRAVLGVMAAAAGSFSVYRAMGWRLD